MILNVGGGESAKYQLIVKTATGSTVTVTKGETVKQAKEKNGIWGFRGLSAGDWLITCTKDGLTAVETVTIVDGGYCIMLELSYRVIPEFTYTGDYEIVTDSDEAIVDQNTYQGNWKIRFLTSGELTFTKLNSAKNGIDVFCVGGGGGTKHNTPVTSSGNSGSGGGGGGYTMTQKAVSVNSETIYTITIGAGGSPAGKGGETSAFDTVASGGLGAGASSSYYTVWTGAYGGCGGGGGSTTGSSGDGGSDGGNGGSGYKSGGTGQIDNPGPNGETGSTREFGEPEGKLYAGGGAGDTEGSAGEAGAGGGGSRRSNGIANTGGGAGGAYFKSGYNAYYGGSGIVVIRAAKEAA